MNTCLNISILWNATMKGNEGEGAFDEQEPLGRYSLLIPAVW